MFQYSIVVSAVLLGLAVPVLSQQAQSPVGGGSATLGHRQVERSSRAVSRPSPIQRRSSGRSATSRARQFGRRVARVIGGGARHSQRVDTRHGGRLDRGHHRQVSLYRTEKVWVPGVEHRVWVPAQYEYRYDPYCGQTIQVLVRAGHYHLEQGPGHWEYRRVRVPSRTYQRQHHRLYFP